MIPKSYYLINCFLILLILTSCKQKQKFEICSAQSFDFLEQQIDHVKPNSLFVFDIDDTLFSIDKAPPGQASEFDKLWQTKIDISEKNSFDKKLHKLVPVLIEPRIVALIERLQQKGIKVIALTAAGHGTCSYINDLLEYRIHLLHSVGIHLEKSFPKHRLLAFTKLAVGNYLPVFYRGVLFSKPSTKGLALAAFLQAMAIKNPVLYYFDNDQGYVEEIARTAQLLHISGQGFVYHGLDYVPAESLRLYNAKLLYLLQHDVWLSDFEAKWLATQADCLNDFY